MNKKISTCISPTGSMNILSAREVARLQDASKGGLYTLFRNCVLAVLHCHATTDNVLHLMEQYADFDITLHQEPRGLKVELVNAPADAFVNGKLIEGVRENMMSVLRDILSAANTFTQEDDTTNLIFESLRNTGIFIPGKEPNLIVCWGGHSINPTEYEYCKETGYQLGLRNMDICTGCGPGAMKAPMKGAYLGHAKQRTDSRLIGLSEPGIIAAETPNAIVNRLIIMPDMEKRLESFIRLGHGIVVFPGGVGTVEEILYLLGVLLHEENTEIPFPLVFTGPASSESYFDEIDAFIRLTLGEHARNRYRIIIDDPVAVAQHIVKGVGEVKEYRKTNRDAYYYNWNLTITKLFQKPFIPSHDNMSKLSLCQDMPTDLLAANLRCAMSGIVCGNIKQAGIEAINEYGPFLLRGDKTIMNHMDNMLKNFIRDDRMKLPSSEEYLPCYRIRTVSDSDPLAAQTKKS